MGFMDAAKSEGTTATGVALVRSARKSVRALSRASELCSADCIRDLLYKYF
jgi:hypothetical protein